MIRRLLVFCLAVSGLSLLAGPWIVGSTLSAPALRRVGDPPAALRAATVRFDSRSGAELAAWYGAPEPGAPVLVLSHGVRGSRGRLRDHALFLRRAGYGVLVYDAQAHGESTGDRITFGHLEAHDAAAAVDYVRRRHPDSSVGFLGPSLAGASALLGSASRNVDALILEAVYPTLESAVRNRIRRRLGSAAPRLLAPLLLWQVEPRLGFDPFALNPVEHIAGVAAPILIIAGSKDEHTTLADTEALFSAATAPKELWVIEGAAHLNFHRFAGPEYERRVLAFLGAHL